jgi:diaminohydroxyphosphoribosylaminopyrimidine deaminase/5-amino-6-(5-phosphoribosylamino)uracil reductase
LTSHETYINRCIQIGKLALGTARPNPNVGCVIVNNHVIIGEGFTSPYGGSHAEVNAINSVKDITLLKNSTLYVTLEPCSHFGKTPPCSDLIIKHGIPNVVIGCLDDNPEVAGKGIEKLKNAGVNVILGVNEGQCKLHHRRFFTFQIKKRPYIILKWAQTSDGFIAPVSKAESKPVWITNKSSRQLAHKWRTEEQAILVGAQTVIDDNPSLTVRDWTGNNPIRVVIDKNESLEKSFQIFDESAKTMLISKNNVDFTQNIAKQISSFLYKENINSVIIEGGKKTLQSFIDEELWDEARVFQGATTFKNGLSAPVFNGKHISETTIEDDVLNIYRND